MPPRHFNAALRGLAARRALRGLLVCALLCAGSVTAARAAGWTREPVPRLPDDPLSLTRLAEAAEATPTEKPAEAEPAKPEAAAPAAPTPDAAQAAAPTPGPTATTPEGAGPEGAATEKPEPPAAPPPKQWGPAQIVIYKARRSLALYRHGDFYREYPVVLGLNPEGRKRHADDARTPEGLYRVVRKRPHARWQYFLDLDYPNARDREIYAREKAAGRIPDEDGQPFPIGGSIGIHGNDRADQQAAGLDWTKGCIALDPSDIAEVEALTPVGTPVWIVQ